MAEKDTIRLKHGEVVTYTFTVYRGGSVVDLSAYTVTFWAHEYGADLGTNQINGKSTSYVTDGTDGQVTYSFVTADTTFSTNRDFKGLYSLRLSANVGNDVEWTDFERFIIARNPFVAES